MCNYVCPFVRKPIFNYSCSAFDSPSLFKHLRVDVNTVCPFVRDSKAPGVDINRFWNCRARSARNVVRGCKKIEANRHRNLHPDIANAVFGCWCSVKCCNCKTSFGAICLRCNVGKRIRSHHLSATCVLFCRSPLSCVGLRKSIA